MLCAIHCGVIPSIAKCPEVRLGIIRIHNLSIVGKDRFLSDTGSTLSVINHWQRKRPYGLCD